MKNENINKERRGFIKIILGSIFAGTIFSGENISASGKWESVNSQSRYSPASMDSAYMGDIIMVAFDWAPRHWLKCDGQILAINVNQALFSLLGTTYGGNGIQNFALPNLQGKSPMHFGQGPGLSNRTLGEISGEVSHTLIINEMPVHNHDMGYSGNYGTSENPVGLVPAKNTAAVPQYSTVNNSLMAYTGASGGSQPHNNMPPYIVTNFIICTAGLFPPRS